MEIVVLFASDDSHVVRSQQLQSFMLHNVATDTFFLSIHFCMFFYDFNRKVDQVPIFFSGMLQTCSVVDDKSSEHTIIVLHPG